MSKKEQQQAGPKVMDMPRKCKGEACSKKDSRFGFCDEHYMWYKEGLINKHGQKVLDFDKKMQALERRKVKSA